MKMRLVVAAATAALCSHTAFAASEGGDTWSKLQPQPVAGSAQALTITPTASLNAFTFDPARPCGNDGGFECLAERLPECLRHAGSAGFR
jgi:hypothetical protein